MTGLPRSTNFHPGLLSLAATVVMSALAVATRAGEPTTRVAVTDGELGVSYRIIALLAIGVMLALLAWAVYRLMKVLPAGDGVGFSSHWGGFGGAVGGWRLNAAAIYLVLALALAGSSVALVSKVLDAVGPRQATTQSAAQEAVTERPASRPATHPADAAKKTD